MKQFAHLHLHTEYSLLDGAARIKGLFEKCNDKNITAVAMTDHGNMYATMHFLDEALEYAKAYTKKNNLEELTYPVKPIIGSEFYYTDNMYNKTRDETYHLILLAKNMDGYQNLIKLSSLSYIEGMYYKPRIDLSVLRKYNSNLICLTACIAGYIPQKLLIGDDKAAERHILELIDIFGKDNVYVELQNHQIADELAANPKLCTLAEKHGLKTVATNDVHYVNHDDSEMQDVMMCVQMGKKITDTNRLKFPNDSFYLKTREEMEEILGEHNGAIDTTLEIAAKCEIIALNKESKLPPYFPDDNSTPSEYLRKLCYKGLVERYPEITDEIRARTEYELGVIIKMGFAEYYLIVWDFINHAGKIDVPVGAGRGSGVGSIVAYAMRITNVDPLKYNLIFERFLNEERVSNPDFDIDFCYEGRGKVIDYVIGKYGKDNVTQIVTFGTMAAKAAIKDVARVYDMPYKDVDEITKMLPSGKIHIEEALGLKKTKDGELILIEDLRRIYNENSEARRVIEMSIKLEGMPRNTSIHAAGVVICDRNVSDYAPLAKNGSDVTTQYNKDQVEELGLLKMDFLGLKTLTDIKKALRYIKDTKGVVIDFDKLGYDDPEIYLLIGRGDTEAVFQLESPGMKRFMIDLQPKDFEDIIAGISLYRPGPMDAIPSYIANRKNPDAITYAHPSLVPILSVTYGTVIYQEQVMAIVRELGGYSFGRADILRRAMSKKKADVMKKEKEIFLNGCAESKDSTAVEGAINRGIPADIAGGIYDNLLSFASYAFNKSHAAAYAVLSYQTAYLKRYYPVELVCGIINDRINNQEEVAKYLNYLKQYKIFGSDKGVPILPPSLNKSKLEFYPENGGVRYGLVGIKGVGEQAMQAVIEEKEKNGDFTSFDDFVNRSHNFTVNKKMIDSMIKAGVFDELNLTRATLMASYERALEVVSKSNKIKASDQYSMFDMIDDKAFKLEIEYNVKPEFDKKLKLLYEKEALGLYVSGHPLEPYSAQYAIIPFNTGVLQAELAELETEFDEDEVDTGAVTRAKSATYEKSTSMAGMFTNLTHSYDKQGREMYRGSLEDLFGSIEIIIFSRSTERYKDLIRDDNIIKVYGRINNSRGSVSMSIDRIEPWELYEKHVEKTTEDLAITPKSAEDKTLYVNVTSISNASSMINRIIALCEKNQGNTEVKVVTLTYGAKQILRSPFSANISKTLLFELYGLVGEENVVLRDNAKG